MHRVFLVLIGLSCFMFPLVVYSEEKEQISSKPNFDGTLIHKVLPPIYLVQGSSLISWEDKNTIVREIIIQYNKLGAILGQGVLLKFIKWHSVFNVAVVSREELDRLIGSTAANAITIDGVIYLTPYNIDPDSIRHEVFHSMVYANVKNKVPWWIEEGLAQILSGELDQIEKEKPRAEIEIKYHDARLKVSGLIKRCGFKSFSSYLDLIKKGNTEHYAYNKIFNESCGYE